MKFWTKCLLLAGPLDGQFRVIPKTQDRFAMATTRAMSLDEHISAERVVTVEWYYRTGPHVFLHESEDHPALTV